MFLKEPWNDNKICEKNLLLVKYLVVATNVDIRTWMSGHWTCIEMNRHLKKTNKFSDGHRNFDSNDDRL